ncbi:MAG: hypothetical protein MZU95_05055 [Desulfomicrobium escambiense]|nr:hypothetical protein [Desulfomicrobium escambiense]
MAVCDPGACRGGGVGHRFRQTSGEPVAPGRRGGLGVSTKRSWTAPLRRTAGPSTG